MQILSILKALGVVVLIIALGLLVPTIFAALTGSPDLKAFLMSFGLSAACGGALLALPKTGNPLKNQDGFALVSFGWLAAGLFGALPYLFSDAVPSLTDAYFESISGFTTTGASVFTEIENKSQPLLLWRSMTQWFGGMGIIVLTIAIIPYLDIGGMSIFQAEVPGPTAEKLTPRIQDTAKVLWIVYLLFTLLLVALLWLAGMNLFDSINHSFATMSTGGFSTKNASVAGFHNPLIEWIITLFMLLAGVNFALHYRFLFQKFNPKYYLKDSELHFYLLVVGLSIAAITTVILTVQGGHFESALRGVAFTVVSIVTTTGFGTADFELWPIFGQMLLLLLMVMGGCAGSTSGGVKSVRIMLVLKYMYVEMLKLLHPHLVRDVKMQDQVVERSVLSSILGFLFIYISVMVFSILLVSFQTDFITAISAVIACLSNIGPGLGSVGPTDNFAHLGDFTKWVLSLNMVLGRLEIITLLILFLPQSWSK
ncbi:MAG: TrkH family potassium uptake protein [bacterium]|nr:TrkH family potassium uptake protein [bacterium]